MANLERLFPMTLYRSSLAEDRHQEDATLAVLRGAMPWHKDCAPPIGGPTCRAQSKRELAMRGTFQKRR